MGFGDLKTENGVKALNEYLADLSYIEGYQASQADVAVYDALSSKPDAAQAHALRWYNHIHHIHNAHSHTSLPGIKKALSEYGPASSTAAASDDDDDSDIDLFGSDEEVDEEKERIKEERIAAYTAKKSHKPVLIAKSNIILDVKPWSDETDMKALEDSVRSIEIDGLRWGGAKLVPVGYGIKKLVISCIVEDDKVGTDILEEEITKFDELIQSMDVAAFNKV